MMEFTFDGMVRYGFGFYNPNHAAALICAIFPFLWGWKKYPWAGWIISILLTIPLAMTYSRSGVIVLVFEFAAYIVLTGKQNWKIIAGIAAAVLGILAIYGVFGRFAIDKSLTNRPEIWFAGLKLYAANPLGVGIGNSGNIVSAFMLENINCRTLINSHFTLLTELGILAGVLWFGMIFYALCNGVAKVRSWCAFAGMCLSAVCSSIFDWDLLSDFHKFGNLTRLNFILSYLLLAVFFGLAGYLIASKFNKRKFYCAVAAALFFSTVPLVLFSSQTPEVRDNVIRIPGKNEVLILHDEDWNLKTIQPFCPDGFYVSPDGSFIAGDCRRVMLFGNMAEYAGKFPDRELIFVNPPEFFEFPENTIKIYLRGFDRRNCKYEVEYF